MLHMEKHNLLPKSGPHSSNEFELNSDCASRSSMPSSDTCRYAARNEFLDVLRGKTDHVYVNRHNGKVRISSVFRTPV